MASHYHKPYLILTLLSECDCLHVFQSKQRGRCSHTDLTALSAYPPSLTHMLINIPASSATLHPKQLKFFICLLRLVPGISFCEIKSLKMAMRNNATANSPMERTSLASLDQKLAMAKRCSHEGVMAGAKAAVVASIATAIPTLASVKMLPWARANLNHTAQALIISTVAGAAYFIVADKTVLATARKNSFNPPSNA
ncbi:hypothetical protein RJT34_32573 [Clitoria ternatea]|uniref:Early nodulin-93-like n=1 Tax=Clitoria ternatea TaxID=43366 RepID=A0AAN9EWD6_CLITE